MGTTIRRTTKLSEQDRANVVKDYMTTNDTNAQIADRYSTTEKNVELIVARHWKSLTNIRETKNLVGDQMNNLNHKGGNYMALKAIGRVPSINQDFLDLLSDPTDPELTDNELQYCWVYAASGENYEALHEAGLHIGLMGSKGDKERHQYQLSCRLRGLYLRKKRNVAEYIIKLKEEQFLPEIVDRSFVQKELLEQLAQLKEMNDDVATRREIGKTLERLGRSVGAFSDVVKVQEVDPASALDYLESLAKADASLIESEELLLTLESEE